MRGMLDAPFPPLGGGAAPERRGGYVSLLVISWCKTPDGWAVNLDGTKASAELSLPRIELHSGANGWTCVCHRQNGTFLKLPLGGGGSTRAAKHAAAEAMLALGTRYGAQLLALLGEPSA
jgi:hypothetical protein